jgi:lupus La protein
MTERNGTAAAEAPPTPLEQKIIRQIEYYFGDLNLMRDKFLQGLIREDDGCILDVSF